MERKKAESMKSNFVGEKLCETLPDLVLNLCMCHGIWTEPARASAELVGR